MKTATVFKRCSLLLMVAGALLLSPFVARAQQFNNTPLKTILKEITNKTGYTFVYSDALKAVDEKVTFRLDGKLDPIAPVLTRLFEGKGISFKIEGKQILLTPTSIDPDAKSTRKRTFRLNGIIRDSQNEPLPGVDIVNETGNTHGSTNVSGVYSIEVSPGDELTINFLGMKTQSYTVGNSNVKDFFLEEDIENLEGTVVTGYQTISRERATGAFDVIDNKLLEKRPVLDLSTALQGTMAGMRATENADGSVSFLFRGAGTLNGSTSPLIVVDGFPVSSNDFSEINPNDVESVTLLKDAAAASIWGARAGNGVIVVTTKRMKSIDKFTVDVNAFTRVSALTDLDQVLDVPSSEDEIRYVRLCLEKDLFDGVVQPNWSGMTRSMTFADHYIHQYKLGNITRERMDQALDSLARIDNRDQLREYLLQHQVVNQINVNISGQTRGLKTYNTLQYENGKGNVIKNGYQKYVMNFNNEINAGKAVKITLGAYLQYRDNETSGPSFSEMENFSRYVTLLNPDGSYTQQPQSGKYFAAVANLKGLENFPYPDWTYNLLQEVRGRERTNSTLSARLQASLNVKLFKGVDFDIRGQMEKSLYQSKSYYSPETYYVRNNANNYVKYNRNTGEVTAQYVPLGGLMDQGKSVMNSYVVRGQLNVNRSLAKDLDFAGVLGSEISVYENNSTTYPRVYGYDPETNSTVYPPYGTGAGNYETAVTTYRGYSSMLSNSDYYFGWSKDKYVSFYSNMSLTYKRKYTLSGNARSDASNFVTSDPAKRWSPMWSVGGLWRISQEDFVKDNASFIDNLALRVTHGRSGNAVKSSMQPLLYRSYSPSWATHTFYYSISDYGNPSLTWEKVVTTNVGIDFGFGDGLLFGKVDFYNRHSKDLSAEVTLSGAHGVEGTLFPSQTFNNSEILNRGVEIELQSTVKAGDFTWSPMITYAYNWNKVIDLYWENLMVSNLQGFSYSSYGKTEVEGYPVNPIFSHTYLGMNPEDGLPYIKGPDGEPVSLRMGYSGPITDLNYEGTGIPPHTLGFMNNFSFHGFNLFVVMVGEFGGVYRNPTFNYPTLFGNYTNAMRPNRFVKYVLDGDLRYPGMPPYQSDFEYEGYELLNTLVESSSFVELKEINLQYTLPKSWVRTLRMENLRIYAQARNLGTLWVANSYGYHPQWLPGTNRPRPTFTFGINAKF